MRHVRTFQNREVGMAGPDMAGSVPSNDSDSPKSENAKKRPTKVLPTTRVGFQKQLTMLRSYAELATPEKPATTPEVAKLVGLHPNTAVYAVSFFVDTGMLQKVGQGYIAPPEVVNYHRAMGWNAETAGTKLAPILRRTWFARRLLPKLSLSPVDEKDAVEALALDASVGKEFSSSLVLLLEYLAIAGLVRREAGMLHPGAFGTAEEAGPRQESHGDRQVDDQSRDTRRGGVVATTFATAPEGVLRFNVDVSVDMKEFATWRPERISAFWAGIAQVLAAKAAVEDATGR
jgi:hypothetical protein